VKPKQSAAERTSALLSPDGGGTVTFALRYFPRPP
jgi:hypothetical protein